MIIVDLAQEDLFGLTEGLDGSVTLVICVGRNGEYEEKRYYECDEFFHFCPNVRKLGRPLNKQN